MMPSSFFTAFCDIHISCIAQSLLLSLVIQSPDIVLHVLRCHFHRSGHIVIRVCECRPYISIREVLTDHPFAHLFTVFIVQILLCLSLPFSFPFIRDLIFLSLCKLWIDFHFQLIAWSDLLRCIDAFHLAFLQYPFFVCFLHLIQTILVCCFIVVRDIYSLPSFLSHSLYFL